ncbi:MAG TPA: molybdenum cofactor guanylyltransferase [Anaerolineae bacterium]
MEPVSAIILAGGQSRRMGRDKALIAFEDRPIIAHVIDTLRELSDDVLVVSNRSAAYESFGIRIVPDADPPSGPLGGISAGLAAAQHDLAIVVACDMPFLNTQLLRSLVDRAVNVDAVVPLTGDQFEPLHAVYRRTCLAAIERHLAGGDRRVISFFDEVRVKAVPETDWRSLDPTGRSIANLNTPDDLLQLHQA